MKTRKIIEIHTVKNYPYSNLNRDELGTPKTCMFAGEPHGRISSQSLKRSWREYFKENYDKNDVSVRTRALPGMVKEYLENEGKDPEFVKAAVNAVKSLFEKEDTTKKKSEKEDAEKKELITGQVIPLSPAEIMLFKEEFVNVDMETLTDKKKRESFVKDLTAHLADLGTTSDIALFGRMVTSSVINSPEASMQVAHAISTNVVTVEQDIFTAVDDMISEGAGMFGVAEYDSCCYYEYACLDFDLLVENCGGDEAKAKALVPQLIETIAFSNPSGKKANTGTNKLPAAMMIEMKNVPYNLVDAYAKPCNAIEDSVQKLAKECDSMQHAFGIEAKRYWFSRENVVCKSAEAVETFPELVAKASALV